MVGEVTGLPGEVNNQKLPDIDLSESEITMEQVGHAEELLSVCSVMHLARIVGIMGGPVF